jgi:amidophosphoribosyltransferase
MPGQQQRMKSVRQKLSTVELEFKGKNVLLVDDSIVRGTTSRQIVQMAREAGAEKVYLASAAPAVRYPNVYGIDMPAAHEFVAHGNTEQEIADYIGVDWLIYQDIEDLKECALGINEKIQRFDCSVFDGNYVTGSVDDEYLNRLESKRNDDAKNKRSGQMDSEVIELHNQA